jgi:hypothetical protein
MRYLSILILIILQFCGSARAGCTISQTSTTNTSGSFFSLGQSWTATCDGVLSNVTVNIGSATAGTLTLSIYSGESVAPGNLLYSQPITFSDTGVQSLNLTGTVNITNGKQYTFVVTSTLNELQFLYSTLNPYTDGKACTVGGFVASSDLYFTATISDAAPVQSVPSLSEYGMIIMAVILINISMFAIRKRKDKIA